jgi:hypothetical protein
MRVFSGFNPGTKEHPSVCPVCGTARDQETVLIEIVGTAKDGIAEAKQVHLECLDLRYDIMSGGRHFIFQRVYEGR